MKDLFTENEGMQRANCTVTIGFTPRLYVAIRSAAVETGLSFAGVVRKICEAWLAANPEYEHEMTSELPPIPRMARAASDRIVSHKHKLELAHAAVAGRSVEEDPILPELKIPTWPASIEWRSTPPVGGLSVPWNEVNVWVKEAERRHRANPMEFREPPSFSSRATGEPVDEWQSGLRVALGLPAQPEDVLAKDEQTEVV